jgi:hypothetical protein
MDKLDKKDVIINFAKLKPNLVKKNPDSSKYKVETYRDSYKDELPYLSS